MHCGFAYERILWDKHLWGQCIVSKVLILQRAPSWLGSGMSEIDGLEGLHLPLFLPLTATMGSSEMLLQLHPTYFRSGRVIFDQMIE